MTYQRRTALRVAWSHMGDARAIMNDVLVREDADLEGMDDKTREGFTGLQAEKDINKLRDAINYLDDAISELLEVATV